MMAESLPYCGPAGTLAGWELEAWYKDLEDILCSDTQNADCFQTERNKQNGFVQMDTTDDLTYFWTLEPMSSSLPVELSHEDVVALEADVDQLPSEVLDFLSTGTPASCSASLDAVDAGTIQQTGTLEQECYSSSPTHTLTEDEESSAGSSGTKRKRRSQPRGGKVRVKERELENEKKVAHLVSENERLKGEIERLSIEVEKTRKDLIERMVNLNKV
ncbi:DNA damage-inducible transcript 3 protein [Spea bombifrons]|uniref:DNA damage-inducible transcript 3 protein n=1 Tax=Spea bombifrons TaxID=233779 RepID=UPI002349C92A|nr:DNA damage-inducible transcript 3 protein [Spea bombifrons]